MCPARTACSLWETASTRCAASGSGQRGAGVMDDGRGGRDPGSAGRGLWAGGGRALGQEGVFPCKGIAGIIRSAIASMCVLRF